MMTPSAKSLAAVRKICNLAVQLTLIELMYITVAAKNKQTEKVLQYQYQKQFELLSYSLN